MSRALVAILFVAAMAGCAFDRSGLGTHASDDAGAGGALDAPGSGTGTGSGEPPDAKPQQGTPDAMVVTAPDAATHAGVGCGNETCVGNNVCCVSFSNGGTHYSCDDKCGTNEATFSCDGPEDCKQDELCCFSQLGSRCGKTCGPQQDVACRAPSDCPDGFGGQQQMCCPTQYPNVQLCQDICF